MTAASRSQLRPGTLARPVPRCRRRPGAGAGLLPGGPVLRAACPRASTPLAGGGRRRRGAGGPGRPSARLGGEQRPLRRLLERRRRRRRCRCARPIQRDVVALVVEDRHPGLGGLVLGRDGSGRLVGLGASAAPARRASGSAPGCGRLGVAGGSAIGGSQRDPAPGSRSARRGGLGRVAPRRGGRQPGRVADERRAGSRAIPRGGLSLARRSPPAAVRVDAPRRRARPGRAGCRRGPGAAGAPGLLGRGAGGTPSRTTPGPLAGQRGSRAARRGRRRRWRPGRAAARASRRRRRSRSCRTAPVWSISTFSGISRPWATPASWAGGDRRGHLGDQPGRPARAERAAAGRA